MVGGSPNNSRRANASRSNGVGRPAVALALADVAARLATGAAASRRAAVNITDARDVSTGAAGLVPEVPTPADLAVVASIATVGVDSPRVRLRVFCAEALCTERAVDLAVCELVAASALSLGLPVSAHATPAPELTAAPMPRATSRPPRRPTLSEAFI